jgi:ABC-2 type transport system ATP-binding protein
MTNNAVNPLQIINISKQFGEHKVLQDVSLSINQGQIYGLVGLNGIGKTTLIKIILGLLKQDEGQIQLYGKANSILDIKKKYSYLPEKFHPSAFLKGEEFLSLSISYYGKKYNRQEAIELCEELDLSPKVLDSRIGNYSKGMGQKLGLVSAFMADTPLLILDEPMSGLDPRARIALKKKLRQYVQNGKRSIFFTSHILSDIEAICEKIAILDNGKIHYEGSVKQFVAKANNLEEAFIKITEGVSTS